MPTPREARSQRRLNRSTASRTVRPEYSASWARTMRVEFPPARSVIWRPPPEDPPADEAHADTAEASTRDRTRDKKRRKDMDGPTLGCDDDVPYNGSRIRCCQVQECPTRSRAGRLPIVLPQLCGGVAAKSDEWPTFRGIVLKQDWPPARVEKFRQAGFVYLHVAILYEAAVYAMLETDALPLRFGPPLAWLIAGAGVAGFVFVGLYYWRNVWFARVVWVLNGARTPSLITGAFFAAPDTMAPSAFYLTALVVVVINLWMLARAGWDL